MSELLGDEAEVVSREEASALFEEASFIFSEIEEEEWGRLLDDPNWVAGLNELKTEYAKQFFSVLISDEEDFPCFVALRSLTRPSLVMSFTTREEDYGQERPVPTVEDFEVTRFRPGLMERARSRATEEGLFVRASALMAEYEDAPAEGVLNGMSRALASRDDVAALSEARLLSAESRETKKKTVQRKI